jgi:hypothetical protein
VIIQAITKEEKEECKGNEKGLVLKNKNKNISPCSLPLLTKGKRSIKK